MTEEQESIVDKHLRGLPLTQDEERVFQEAIADEHFKSELDEMIAVQSVAGKSDRIKMKNLLIDQEKSYARRPYLKWIFILGILIAMIGSLYLIIRPSKDRSAVLYAQYYKPYPNIVDPITKGNNSLSPYQLYEQGQYQQAIDKFNDNDTLSTDDMLYLGFAYLANGDTEKAANSWSALKDGRYAEVVEWYRGLICLKTKTTDCKSIFRSISAYGGIYEERALSILEELE